MDENRLFPKLEPAMAVAARYLTEKVRDDSKLSVFQQELGKLKVEKAVIIDAIRKHAEWLHSSGRCKTEDVSKIRGLMEPAAVQYAQRCFEMFLAQYTPKGTESEEHAARLSALTQAVQMAQARGDS
jgi:hypothetical protein